MLRPALAEAAAARFERKHTVVLPAGYRAFLTTLGDGGAGPYYGLEPLDRWHKAVDKAPGALARPSPLEPGMPDGVDAEVFLGCEWDALTDGAITLVDQGCAASRAAHHIA